MGRSSAAAKRLVADYQHRVGGAVERALTRGLATLDAIAARRRDTGITEAETVAYLKNFIYRFGPDEGRSIAHFARFCPT